MSKGSRNKKTKQKKKTKARPPRVFVKKGKLYIRVGKKKYLIQDQKDYSKRELLDIIFKELLVRRKKRKKGKYTKREQKLDENDKKTYEEFERLNKSQSRRGTFSVPSSLKLKSNSNSLYNAVVPWSQANIQPIIPSVDVNKQILQRIAEERKLQLIKPKEEKKEEKKQVNPELEMKNKILTYRVRGDQIYEQIQKEYNKLSSDNKKRIKKEYYNFFKAIEQDIKEEDDPTVDLKLKTTYTPQNNYRRVFGYLFSDDKVQVLEQFLDLPLPAMTGVMSNLPDNPIIEEVSSDSSPPLLEEEPAEEKKEEKKEENEPIIIESSILGSKVVELENIIKSSNEKKRIKSELKNFISVYNSENPLRKIKNPPSRASTNKYFKSLAEQLFDNVINPDELENYIDKLEDIIEPLSLSDNPDLEQKYTENKSEAENIRAEIIQNASGYYKNKGLNTKQINNIMRYNKKYIGCFPANFNKYLPDRIPNKCGFIMNTDDDKKAGSHWVAVYIDKNSEINYYDSFGREPTKDFMKRLNKLISKIKPNTYLKMKINKIKDQKSTTNNCGFFCCKFLIDRFNNKPFRECSGYDNSIKGESDIKKIINKYPSFNYI